MPKMIREIEGADLAIARPVVMDVVRQVCIQLDLPKGLEVEMMGDSPTPLTTGSAISDSTDSGIFSKGAKVKVGFKEMPVEDSWYQTHDYYQYQSAILVDERIKTKMYPIRDIRKVEVALVFRFSSRTAAQRALTRIRNRIAKLQKNYIHSVTYAYPLPDDLIATLYAIQETKEAQYGYGETPRQWLDERMTGRMRVVSNLVGKEQTMAIETTDTGIIGGLSDEIVPDREKNNKGITYMFTSTYTFFYSPPTSVVLEYPMFLHQKSLPEKYRGITGKAFNRPVEYQFNHEARNEPYLSDAMHEKSTQDGWTIPSWDEWHTKFTRREDEVRLFNVACMLDPVGTEDALTIMDLHDLPVTFSPAVWNYIATVTEYVTQRGYSPFLVELWDWDDLVDSDDYYITQDGKLIMNSDLCRRTNWHVTISLDLKFQEIFPFMWKKYLINHPELINEIIKFITPDAVIPEIVPGKLDLKALNDFMEKGFVRRDRARLTTVFNTALMTSN